MEALRGRASGLWSLRVDDQYRIILHRTPRVATLLFVAPHDDAYRFAERVPKTGYASGPSDVQTPAPSTQMAALPAKQLPAADAGKLTKYVPLARHLVNIDPKITEIEMSFSEIENLLKSKLPPSARKHQAWWANDAEHGHVQAKAWLSVGWRRKRLSLTEESLAFERQASSAKVAV
jgi:hypothetical protein